MKPMCLVNVAGCLVLGSGVFFGIWQWDWIVTGPTGEESGSTTLRNLGLVSGGFIAIWIAIWRGDVADSQAQASQEQARASLNQVEISRLSLLNERYQKGAEMLGSTALYVRLGGIYALQRLAQENPEQYHGQITDLLSIFMENPPAPDERNYFSGGNFFSQEGEIAKKAIEILKRSRPR